MKTINILSLTQALDNLDKPKYKSFLEYYNIQIKDSEVGDLKSLIDIFQNELNSGSIFSHFYIGYKIPQIGKEFDLLRFGKKCVINIELKSSSTKEKVLKQLIRNKYYLCFLKKEIHNFSFISDKKKLYCLNDKNELTNIKFSYLVKLLTKQEIQSIDDVNKLFNPSDYLVSPFNSTKKFITNKYFLTHQQEETKGKILKTIVNNSIANFISITGSAGTGKTLLTYDIVKEVMDNDGKVLVIHCGQLNNGQHKLNSEKWNIVSIKHYESHELSDYDLIVIDEVQRIYPDQLKKIIKKIHCTNGNCIFAYDKLQTLSAWEVKNNIDKKINGISSITSYKLSEKIRTNKEIASFIKVFFNKNRNIGLSNKGNIELNYFKDIDDAKGFLTVLSKQGWEVIRFTPSQYGKEHHEKCSLYHHETSHKVIGQEFDKVAVIIDKNFTYNKDGNLVYSGKSYYSPAKMLFQNMTRTRKKLNIIIIDNNDILERCLSVLK